MESCVHDIFISTYEKESDVLVLLKANPVDISSQKLFKVLPLPDYKQQKSKS